MDNASIISLLTVAFAHKISDISEPSGLLTITVKNDSLVEIVSWLEKHEILKFNFLTDITAVHYPEKKNEELAVVYHLHSLTNNKRIRLKVLVSAENPKVDSLTNLFQSANWMERETYDFFGVLFQGHPNLTRILNMDEMDYYPMLKQYPLEDQKREDKDDKFFGR